MRHYLEFLLESGKLKGKERRGWVVHQIKNSETTAEHIFHLAVLVFALGSRKKLNMERAIKMAIIHDLCEVYAPDLTPYDPLLPKNKKKIKEVLKHWPKFTPALKIKKEVEKHKVEEKALNKLVAKLPPNLKNEILGLWYDYECGITKEGRFVKQADKIVNFLQGIEYWKKYGKIQHKLWTRWIKEIIDDPVLLDFIKETENKFIKK
jgi:putative hydrolase of HD superfamily